MAGRRDIYAAITLLPLAMSGCGSSSGASPQATLPPPPTAPLLATAPPRSTAPVTTAPVVTPTIASTVLPATAHSAEAAVIGFSAAVIRRDRAGTTTYLSTSLQARVADQGVDRLLGAPATPTAYQYAITTLDPSSATANLTYQYAGGAIIDTATLGRTSSGWRITAIHPT